MASLDPAALIALVPKLIHLVDEYRHILSDTLPSELGLVTSHLENLDHLAIEAITAHENSISNSMCLSTDQATNTYNDLVNPVLDRVDYLHLN